MQCRALGLSPVSCTTNYFILKIENTLPARFGVMRIFVRVRTSSDQSTARYAAPLQPCRDELKEAMPKKHDYLLQISYRCSDMLIANLFSVNVSV